MEEVVLIAGKLNRSDSPVLYWKNEKNIALRVGDYAIVENRQSFDLVEIVGIVRTYKNKVGHFTKNSYETVKNVIKIIEKEELVKENRV